jgi:leucyl-tRNA synthetase
MQLFNAWYNKKAIDNGQLIIDGKTEHISTLIAEVEKNGNAAIHAVCDDETPIITASQWKNFSEKEKEDFLQHYRIAYLIKPDGNIDILGVFHGALDIDRYFI